MKTVQTTAECPNCKTVMSKFAAADGVLAGCVTCGGMWIDNTAARWVLLNLLSPDAREYVKTFKSHGSTSAQSVYRAAEQTAKTCPVCRNDLVATKMKDPVVVVDICPEHGTFFDKNELAMIVSTVEIRALQGEADAVADAASAKWNESHDPLARGAEDAAGYAIASLLFGSPRHGLWR